MTLAESNFHALAVEQFDALYGLARRLSGDPGRAEDLVQETYLRALTARESFQLEEFGIRPWVMRILHNLHVTRATRESRQPVAIEGEVLERVPGESNRATALAADDMDQELVWAIDSLPEAYRAVLLLWAVDEKSYAEIAEALSLPPGTVMSRLHRARKRVCEQLGRPDRGRPPCAQ